MAGLPRIRQSYEPTFEQQFADWEQANNPKVSQGVKPRILGFRCPNTKVLQKGAGLKSGPFFTS